MAVGSVWTIGCIDVTFFVLFTLLVIRSSSSLSDTVLLGSDSDISKDTVWTFQIKVCGVCGISSVAGKSPDERLLSISMVEARFRENHPSSMQTLWLLAMTRWLNSCDDSCEDDSDYSLSDKFDSKIEELILILASIYVLRSLIEHALHNSSAIENVLL